MGNTAYIYKAEHNKKEGLILLTWINLNLGMNK